MRTFRKKYLSYLPIKEDVFKADFQILDKYQGVSSELLRLAMIGLAVYGFIITNIIFKVNDTNTINQLLKAFVAKRVQLTCGGALLLLSSAFALAHRYFSTDSMSHHIRGIRLRMKWQELMDLTETKKIVLQPPLNKYKKSELDLIPIDKLTNDQISFWIKYLKIEMKSENNSLESDFDKCLVFFVGADTTLVGGIGLALWGFMSFLAEIKL